MNKLFKRIKDNNKGFTLVELIVVIAVLAVITVVAAPQYLQYVEKAKIGTDENALGELAHIAEIEYVGLQAVKGSSADNTVIIEITGGHATVTTPGTADSLDKAVNDTTFKSEFGSVKNAYNYEFKSEKYDNGTVTITIGANGNATKTNNLPFGFVQK